MRGLGKGDDSVNIVKLFLEKTENDLWSDSRQKKKGKRIKNVLRVNGERKHVGRTHFIKQ